MNKKVKLLAAPLALGALALTGMIGGTLAYFTSADTQTVHIEAGQVKVGLAASDAVYSSFGVVMTQTAEIDGHDVTYFENGGYAYLEGNELVLNRITPGDKVSLKLVFSNYSNVDAKYAIYPQFKEESTGFENNPDLDYATAKLSQGLVFSLSNEAQVAYGGELIPIAPGSEDVVHEVSIELPADAGNEYQGATSKIVFTTYATQANAPVSGVAYNWASLRRQTESQQREVAFQGDVSQPQMESLNITADNVVLSGREVGGATIVATGESSGGYCSVIVRGDNFSMEDITYIDHTGAHYCTVITPSAHDVSFDGCTFIAGQDGVNDGATYFMSANRAAAGNITIKNTSIIGYYGAVYGSAYFGQIGDILVENSLIDTEVYTINVGEHTKSYVVRNSTFRGWTSYGEDIEETVVFDNVSFEKSSFSDYDFLRAYHDTDFIHCQFDKDFSMEVTSGAVANLTGCTIVNANNEVVEVTAENFEELKEAERFMVSGTGTYVIGDQIVWSITE